MICWAIPENIPPPLPMDDTEFGTQKFKDFQEELQQFLQDSKACCFTILRNTLISLQDFEWFTWNSSQNSQNFVEIHGFPVRITQHFIQDFQCRPWGGGGGGGDIFWNSPLEHVEDNTLLIIFHYSVCVIYDLSEIARST